LGNKRRQRKLENIESELDKICVKLKPRDKEIAKMRLQGMTYAEIGERYGVSRQCIHERMRKIINKSEWIRSVLGDKA
jgi:RNA polymerase sigma factor (sigma-70 family)